MQVTVVDIVTIFVLVLMIVALVLILRILVLMERTLFRPRGEAGSRVTKQS